MHLAQQRNMGERGFAKNRFADLDVRLRVSLSFGSDNRVALFDAEQAEENGGIHSGKKRIDFEAQFIGKLVKIRAASLVHKNFEKAGHTAGARMREHDGFARNLLARRGGFWRR